VELEKTNKSFEMIIETALADYLFEAEVRTL
jgi:hypothetical protein